MKRVQLVHWNEPEGGERASQMEGLGYAVLWKPSDPGALLQLMKEDPPEAAVIDLSRSPAMGRDFGVALRVAASTRRVPLVFVGGDPEKVGKIQAILPDAGYTSWEEIGPALEDAWRRGSGNPIVPDSVLAGYSGTPLPKKLGIKAGARVVLAGAPDGFEDTLGPLLQGARLKRRFVADADLILWFVRSRAELARGIGTWAGRTGKGGIWIIWPKKAGPLGSDLTQGDVRRTGLDTGLVDFKICAVDETWSGLKFVVRKK
ncbi:hypothetical protein ACFL3S_12385 [Gemmatimonadota bacterium]